MLLIPWLDFYIKYSILESTSHFKKSIIKSIHMLEYVSVSPLVSFFLLYENSFNT